ncbi:integrase catalytic domain-containing protein [Trichonephila clavipes]|nr:integrase catalytic domain-containing protein [Trichonephila clavipes]
MNLHKWSSNSPELLNRSLSSDVEHSFSTDIDLSGKTLGISWKPFEDCFAFKQLWQCKLDWDDVLTNSIANEWREFVTTLKCIEEVKINRFIMADNNVRIVLQGFADASEATYGAVVYLQCFLHNGAAKVSILASKSRVASIRVISITRLELCACVLLAQLIKKMHSTLRLNISDIVLHIRIQLLHWHADLVSRGLRPCDLPNLRLWWHGPQFLEKGKLSSEETSLSPVKECEYSKELKTGSSSDIITSSVCVSTNCVSSILSTLLRKTIHIGIVSDLTSDAFIATLKRFFSRRGKCAKLYSDNGKTFVGANKVLKLIEDSDDNLAGFLSAEGIEWKFIPPRAPSFGVVFGKLRLSQ